MAGKAQKKRPAARPRVRRVGFKNFRQLASAMAPFIKNKHFSTYTTSRDMKKIDKKKLQSRPSSYI